MAPATPLPPLPPIPGCKSDTLAQYVALGKGCQLGDKVFFNFSYTPPQGVGPTAAQITVDPIATKLDPGFEFTANPAWDADEVTEDFLLDFDVSVLQNGNLIKDASMVLHPGFAVNQGSTIAIENLCLEGIFDNTGSCSGTSSFLLTFFPKLGTEDSVTLKPPVNFIEVQTDLTLFAAGKGNGVNVVSFTEQLSEVPEPSTMLILGLLAGATRLSGLFERRSSR